MPRPSPGLDKGRPWMARSRCERAARAHPRRALRTGYGQNRHDLHGFAREDREVRMVFEQLRGGFVQIRAHDGVGAHLVADIRDAARRNLLGLAQAVPPCRRSHCGAFRPMPSRRPFPRVHLPAVALREGPSMPPFSSWFCCQGKQRDRYSCS